MRDGNYIKSTFLNDEYINRIPIEQRIIYESLILSEKKDYAGYIQITDRQIRDVINRDDCLEYLEAINEGAENSLEKPVEYRIINTKQVKKYLDNLINDNKILRMPNGYLLINHIKHQNLSTNNCTGLLKSILNMNSDELKIIKSVPKIIDGTIEAINKAIQEFINKWTKKETKSAKSFISCVSSFIDSFYTGNPPSFVIKDFLEKYDPTKGVGKGVGNHQPTTNQPPTNHTLRPTHNSNSNIKSNNNINSKYNSNDSEYYIDINMQNKKETNIESNKILSLGGQNFKDSQDGSQELEREKKQSKSLKERLAEELGAKCPKDEEEEEDKRQLTAITKYHRYTTKGFYYDFDDIKENEIEMISPIMDKCNEYLLDKMTSDEQIQSYNPITYKTGYKILSEFFEGDKELFESILKARIDQWSEYENKDSYRNFDILLYCLMTGVTVKQMTSEEWK